MVGWRWVAGRERHHVSSIRDVARFVDGGNGLIPSIKDDEIETNAWMIWQTVHDRRKAEGSRTRMDHPRTGQPGYAWVGSVNKIVHDLWPALKDAKLVDGSEAEHRKIILNRYLRNSGNLYCHAEGSRSTPSGWWISEHWGGVTTTRTQPSEEERTMGDSSERAQEPTQTSSSDVFDLTQPDQGKQAEKDVEGVTKFTCRIVGCNDGEPKVFAYKRIRAQHEHLVHGVWYNPDGVAITFDNTRHLTSLEIQHLVVRVLREAKGPETLSVIRDIAKEMDPRSSKEQLRAAIVILMSGKRPVIKVTNPRSQFPRYALVHPDMELPPLEPEAPGVPSADTEASNVTVEPDPSSNEVEEMHLTTVDGINRHVANLNELITELGRLAVLEGQLAISADDMAAVTRERDEARREVIELKDKLEAVRKERDEKIAMLDNIQRMFSGGTQA